MRAINLVPADARQGGLNGGKSGGAAYGLVAALAILVVGMYVYSGYKSETATAQNDLATVNQSAQAFSQAATQYTSFEQAASDANARISTVKSLAQARFDWAGSMRDLARLIPESTRISSLDASVSTDSSGGGTSQYRSQVSSPAILISGCTADQNTAATLVTQLQAMRRVSNVTLEYSKKAAPSSATGDGSCTDYTFAIDIFFAAGTAQSSQDAVPSSTPSNTLATETVPAGSATVGSTPAGSTPATATTPAPAASTTTTGN